ncbi:MAG: transcription antitermination factor NusB [Planctomycetota bacterium]|nr:MAG: transcription antitermination factor NusB [Planctomycetota bacterium]
MRRRTIAREVALQFLYQLDLRGKAVLEDLGAFLAEASRDRQVQDFALRLVSGTKELRPELDQMLGKVARNWDLRRMATIDRNVLRMAIFELLYCDDIPPKVSINEAIELGKKFSTANSGAFINGILDRVKNEHLESSKASDSEADSKPSGSQPKEA